MSKDKRYEVVIAGLGGTGLLTAGKVLVEAGASYFKHVLYLPNYGPAMRMGECECTVTFSQDEIGAQGTLYPPAAVVFGSGALHDVGMRLKTGGLLIVDSSLVEERLDRKDIEAYYIPATETARKIGSTAAANIVLLGAYLEKTKALSPEAVEKALSRRFTGKKSESLMTINKEALRQGSGFISQAA